MRNLVTCYFWTALLAFVGAWLLALAAGYAERPSLNNGPFSVIGLVTMVGLGGLVFGKRVGGAAFWKAWLVIEGLYDAYIFVAHILMGFPSRIADSPRGISADAAATLLVMIAFLALLLVAAPRLIGLYIYAFDAPDIWERGQEDRADSAERSTDE